MTKFEVNLPYKNPAYLGPQKIESPVKHINISLQKNTYINKIWTFKSVIVKNNLAFKSSKN
jgi:hypothetical protein